MQNHKTNAVRNQTGYITAASFNRSIEIALYKHFNVEAAIARVNRRIAHCQEGKLYVGKDRGYTVFFEIVNGHHKYLRKKSEKTYDLARRKYLELLLQILELTDSHVAKDIIRRVSLIEKLQRLILSYEAGGLDISRIVLTIAQQRWFFGNYHRKRIAMEIPHITHSGVRVRSKSERDIGNMFEKYAIPYHYEEAISIKVFDLVNKLKASLINKGVFSEPLCYMRSIGCTWQVPEYLQWMNSPGSIWKSYNERTGYITIFNDFKSMLADSDTVLMEHEGLCDDFVYRCNAAERVFVMLYTKSVSRKNLIYTFEDDVADKEILESIIENTILPRLWF